MSSRRPAALEEGMPSHPHHTVRPTSALKRAARHVFCAAIALAVGAGLLTTPPAAAATTQTPPPEANANTVAFFGDSIGYTAEEESRAALGAGGYRVVEYNSVPGDSTEDQVAAIRRRVTGSARPQTLIVELGTNDAEKIGDPARFETVVRTVLDAASPRVTCVRWLDIKPTPTRNYAGVNRNAATFNRILARVADRYQNVEVMHYSAWAAAAPAGSFVADGLHLTGPSRPPVPASPGNGQNEFGRLVRQAADGCNPALTTGPFWDVPDAAPEAPAVAWMAADRITRGYPNGTFRARVASVTPAVTRGEFATWLWHMAGRPTAPSAGWADVGDPRAVDWLTAAGIITRPTDGRYHPDRPLTRARAARALWRAAGSPAPTTNRDWADAPPTDAFDWATDTSVLPGRADGTYQPTRAVTRLALAKALYRLHLLSAGG